MHCDLEDEMVSNANKLHSNRKWKVRAFQNAPKSSVTPSELAERALQLWENQYFPKIPYWILAVRNFDNPNFGGFVLRAMKELLNFVGHFEKL